MIDLPPLPPTDDVVAALRVTVIPAASVAAFVFALFLALGRRASALGSALAVLAGMAYANWIELRLPWNPDAAKPVRIAWEWLPRSALLLVSVGLATRGLGRAWHHAVETWWNRRLAGSKSPDGRIDGSTAIVWLPRLTATIVVAAWLVPDRLREPEPWLLPAFAVTAFVGWIILDALARGGRSISVSFALAAVFFAASIVILYSHSARFMDASVMAGAAFLGLGIVGFIARPADCSGAIPAAVVLLPGLILSTKAGTESQVPLASVLFIALAPLALALWLIPAVAQRNGALAHSIRMILVLIPLVIAVLLAGRVESLPWEAEW